MTEKLIVSVASSTISSVINSLGTLARDETNFLRDVSYKVQIIVFKFRAIQSYLKDAENNPSQSHFTANWLHELKSVTYRAQDVIEKIGWLKWRRNRTRGFYGAFSRYYHIPGYLRSLHEIGAEIDQINSFIPEISTLRNNLTGTVNLGESSSMPHQFDQRMDPDPRTTIHDDEEDEVIGFDTTLLEIEKELLDPSYKPLSVISLVGMGGIGKTTLAKKISSHSDVQNHFDVITSITVSKQYNVLNLQREILKSSTGIKNEDLEKMTGEEVRDKLHKTLKEKTYLIVIDDVWEPRFWDDINPRNKTFPDTNNGSRIILTTRIGDVARCPNFRTIVHELRLLDDEKSWQLLKKKAFPPYVLVSDHTRNQLENLGSPLVKRCHGLPLALVLLGGYLSKHVDPETWSRMAKSTDWKEVGNLSQILALSYHDLSNDLKPTFLYITAFPEDHIIKASDLIKLWIAEGFIPPHQHYTLETRAQLYLDQLNERGLVQVVQRNKTHGWISRIKIHDVLRDWGIERAKEEGHFIVAKDSDHVNSYDAQIPYRVASHGYCVEDIAIAMPHLQTMLGFDLFITNHSIPRLKSLRVVSIIQTQGTSISPKFSKHMIFLRYICLRKCGDVYFPSSIGELCHLQTLDCQRSNIYSLPSSLWEIPNLRHVVLESICCNWKGPKKGSGKNMQTLDIIDYFNAPGMKSVVVAVEDMEKIVKLQLGSYGPQLPTTVLSKISGLRNLEALELLDPIQGLIRLPSASVFPPNILKLVLNCGELVDDPIHALQELPKLVVLHLHSGKFQSMHWFSGGFPQLKYLKLFWFGRLEEWKVDVGAMPSLRQLKLDFCDHLKNFPEGLMQHDQLRLVELYEMPYLRGYDFSMLEDKGCKDYEDFFHILASISPA